MPCQGSILGVPEPSPEDSLERLAVLLALQIVGGYKMQVQG